MFLEISQKSQENTCARDSFLTKLQASGTGVILWILRNFWVHVFYRTPSNDCFCNYELSYWKTLILFRFSDHWNIFITSHLICKAYFYWILLRWENQCHNMHVSVCNFTKSITSPWVIFTFFKLYKWYQIAQNVSYETSIK